jgi:hypothetical protein
VLARSDLPILFDFCCQGAVKKREAENAFVSGDGRSSQWCTVEPFSQQSWRKSVMSVREKCDEKKLGGTVARGSVEFTLRKVPEQLRT